MEKGLVTVIIPVYNGASYLEAAIDSVLSQSYNHLEVIIVNDGSTDETEAISRKYLPSGIKHDTRVSCIFQENRGKLSALNTGIRSSRGEFVTFLDSDDSLPVNSLLDRAEELKKDPGVIAVYGDATYMDRQGNPYRIRQSRPVRNKQDLVGSFRIPIVSSTLMLRREALEAMGAFETTYGPAEDLYRHMLTFSIGEVKYIPTSFLNYRTYRRKNPVWRRIQTFYDHCRVINRHFTGFEKYYLIARQLIFHTTKAGYELLTANK